MTFTGFLLGLINAAILGAILVLVGAIIVWFCGLMGIAVPQDVRRIYLVVCALVVLYMIAALLLGMPTFRIIGSPVVAERPPAITTVGRAVSVSLA